MIKTEQEYEREKSDMIALIDHEAKYGASEEVAAEIEALAKRIEYYETWHDI